MGVRIRQKRAGAGYEARLADGRLRWPRGPGPPMMPPLFENSGPTGIDRTGQVDRGTSRRSLASLKSEQKTKCQQQRCCRPHRLRADRPGCLNNSQWSGPTARKKSRPTFHRDRLRTTPWRPRPKKHPGWSPTTLPLAAAGSTTKQEAKRVEAVHLLLRDEGSTPSGSISPTHGPRSARHARPSGRFAFCPNLPACPDLAGQSDPRPQRVFGAARGPRNAPPRRRRVPGAGPPRPLAWSHPAPLLRPQGPARLLSVRGGPREGSRA